MNGRLHKLKQIARHSDEMLECARESRWDELPALESRRAVVLSELQEVSRHSNTAEINDLEAKLLARIIDTNRMITELGKEYRQQLADSLFNTRRQRCAAVAYTASANQS